MDVILIVFRLVYADVFVGDFHSLVLLLPESSAYDWISLQDCSAECHVRGRGPLGPIIFLGQFQEEA